MRRLAAIAPDRLDKLAKIVSDTKTAGEADAAAQMPIERYDSVYLASINGISSPMLAAVNAQLSAAADTHAASAPTLPDATLRRVAAALGG